jgi:hypothetical protein
VKRVLGFAGSVVLGVTGALAFASAAQAHHTEVQASSVCLDDGGWIATWKVTDWSWKSHPRFENLGAGKIETLESSQPGVDLVGDIVVDAELPYPGEGELVATQTFANDVESATLTVNGVWPNGAKGTGKGDVYRPVGGCDPKLPDVPEVPEPVVTPSSSCWGITITVANNNPEALAEFTLTPNNGDAQVVVTPDVDDPATYSFLFAEESDEWLAVVVEIDGEFYTEYEWDLDGLNCAIEGGYAPTCEGLEWELSIPVDGIATTIVFEPDYTDEQTVVDLEPGAEPWTGSFSNGGDDFVLVITVLDEDGSFTDSIEWTKPEDCDDEVVVPPAEEEEKLDQTGSSLTIMVGSAAALVLGAVVLFLIARRRKAAADW